MSDTENSLYEPNLHFHFVEPGDDKNSNPVDLTACFEKIAERFNSLQQSSWLTENDCLKFDTNSLTKKDVFVFHKFDGLGFEHIQKSKALLLGPKCMLSCMNSDAFVPNVRSPIFSDAMRDLVVCTSGLNSAEKCKIQKLVNYMGGNFENSLSSGTTHLVTNTVMSSKYEKAVAFKMQTLLPEWVFDCWNQCQKRLINASTDELHEKYRIPLFNKMNVTTTGIVGARRDKLSTLLKENGGKFHSTFKSETTDILILDRSETHSEKFRAAIKCKKYCLTPEWITDSVAKGHALPVAEYRVDQDHTPMLKISTPNKDLTMQPSFSGDCTSISEISCNVTVNETVIGRSMPIANKESSKGVHESYKVLLANIQVKQAKAAGPFLDGCNIFLCGFNGEEKEKLTKILSSGSATHFTDYNSSVCYIIVGNPNSVEQAFLRSVSCMMVTLGWVTESIALRQPAAENLHIYRLSVTEKLLDDEKTAHASPASKKNIQSMSGTFRRPYIPKRLDMNSIRTEQQDRDENTLLMQYAKTAQTLDSTTANDQLSEFTEFDKTGQDLSFLAGLKLFFHGFIDESSALLMRDVKTAGGILVSATYSGAVDYLILATDITQYDLNIQAKNIVNDLWMTDSTNAGKCVQIEYYHRPILMDEAVKPLEGLTLVLSIYTGIERDYLSQLGEVLGATVDVTYAKTENPILLCPKPEGAKYSAALKWNLPIVKKDWLLACFERRAKVPFDDYCIETSANSTVDSTTSHITLQRRVTRRTASLQDANQTQPAKKSPNANQPQLVKQVLNANQSQGERKSKTASKSKKATVDLSTLSTPLRVQSVNTAETPKLKHNRISELNVLSPFLSQSPGNVEDPDSLRRFCQGIETPDRQIMYDKIKAYEDSETPVTKQRRIAMGTPETPELPKELFTPFKQQKEKEREAEFWKRREIPKQPRVQTPPFSEIARKFWKNALGYTPSPDLSQKSQSQSQQNTCSTLQPINSVATVVSHQVAPIVLPAAIANQHVKRLSDYIEKNRDVSHSPVRVTAIQDTAPVAATEEYEMHNDAEADVGWQSQSHRFVNRNEIQHKGTPRFSISCSDKVIFERMETQIRTLKGELTENANGYDPTCTHVVCEAPTRSEKIFSSIAAGKWILKTNYIEDSAAVGHFLNEELYEWGNPKSEGYNEELSETGRAAYRWRKKLQTEGEPAIFSKFKAIVHLKKEKVIRNLIEAGGGVFIEASEPYYTSKIAANATHCFTDGKSKLSDTDVAFFKKNNVLVLHFGYLEKYINSDDWPPNISHFAA